MTAQRRSEAGGRLSRVGWTRQTYCLAAFFILLSLAVTLLAALSNPTSQLSICCYAIVGISLLATFVGLLDRRK